MINQIKTEFEKFLSTENEYKRAQFNMKTISARTEETTATDKTKPGEVATPGKEKTEELF